ncbi:non-ribosomal peptide synthetase [Pseudorhodoferax sp. Leaf274]|uniref:non-ribosomal peptide synthetase n=1 Tax=Pseudorhodoferax sp. Leaf274 TaxID=1736318 RepID=UPI000702CA45|nr:non-ribosomal peptide synthetase [Pseudorhodoferax sp. Leaf274]KQP36178.1 non-ribosomal peptide synthetase [Pseudorhodoferax sp. Leaf274]
MTAEPRDAAHWPLTEAQNGLWYAQQLDPANPAFNCGHALWIDGPLDVAAFTAAAEQAAAECESLCLALRDTPDGPQQWIDPARRPALQTIDLSAHTDAAERALAAMGADMQTPLEPTRDALAVQRLYRLGPARHCWYQRAHHLASDGYGMALWSQRLAELYTERVACAPARQPLAPFAQLVAEDAAYRNSPKRAQDAAHWRDALTPVPEVAGLATGRAHASHTCHRQSAPLPADLRASLLAKAQALDTSWPDLLTAWTALYCLRMATAESTVLGIPFMGRLGSAASRASATTMNVLPLAVRATPGQPLADFTEQLVRAQSRARRHGRYRSEQLRRDLNLLGGQRRLHAALINVQPFYKPLALPGLSTRLEILGTGPIDDLTIGWRGDGVQQLALEIEANPALYSEASVAGHLARLPEFLRSALTAHAVDDMPLASPAEAQRHLFALNATEHAVPATTLAALIEAQMAKQMAERPEATALEFEGQALTYAELEQRSRALACTLRARGVGPDRLVAVALPRSLELVVALVAVLRAGGAYLPLDLSHPPERLARVVGLSRPVCALVRAEDAARLPPTLTRLRTADWPQQTDAMLDAPPAPVDAAYVIYTSGSTGEPKGVLIAHQAIVNRLEWMRQHYGFTPDDRILQKTPATFDVSVWEFFLPLVTGCTLVIAPPGAHRDPAALAQIIRGQRITTCHFVPSMLAAFLAHPAARGLVVQRIFCSGEELPAPLRDRLHATLTAELHNLYGPTEAAVDVSWWPALADDRSRPVPIGLPVWNTRLYVLDARMRPLPPGVAGDLYLGGVQLARGYLGRDDLTSERFLPDPHRAGERLYRTGDLARWRAEDGAVVFLGRSDHQVKLRGLRIELGEIEAALHGTGLVARAEVMLREDTGGQDGERRLVAYVQLSSDGAAASAGELRERLAARVPDYMLPAAIVPLSDWPVTSNGKLDRQALPAPRFADGAAAGRAPQTATEVAVAALFAELLRLPAGTAVGADADFFSLGGDSLSAVQLLLQIEERWHRNPGLGSLFETPTVAALAAAIDGEAVRFDNGLKPLIRLAAGDAGQAPLFVVHPAGGIAWGYRLLARAVSRMAPSRSVWGLQSPALAPEHPLPGGIEALAQDYAARVAALQPLGPIHLAGWSVGGIIAQAMAVALQQMGRQVGLVALLDAYPADCWRDEPEPTPLQALRALLAIAGHDPEGHPDLDTRDKVVDFLRAGDTALGNLPAAALEGVVRVVTDTNRLIRQHRHQRMAGTLTHVRAARDHAGKPQLQAARWSAYAGRVDTLEVPLLHAQMTGAEATASIAPLLAARMAQADMQA